MLLQSRRRPHSLQTIVAARPLKRLAGILLAALPGAILACIVHCSLPFSAQGGFTPSPYLCDHMIEAGADLPLPVSTALVQALIQGFTTAAALLVAALTVQPQALIGPPLTRRDRLAEGPPTPPPRLAAAA